MEGGAPTVSEAVGVTVIVGLEVGVVQGVGVGVATLGDTVSTIEALNEKMDNKEVGVRRAASMKTEGL